MLGALDMGGSSTQLIFYNGTNDDRKVHADDFWSHSWLNYGAHRIQERVLDYIYSTYIADMPASELEKLNSQEMTEDGKCPKPLVIPNPCGFKDHKMPYLGKHILYIPFCCPSLNICFSFYVFL